MGATQKEAGDAVGRNERRIREWESEPSWAQAREEAGELWIADAKDAARQTILKQIKRGNSQLGQWLMERTDKNLIPKQKLEHTGRDGGPIESRATVQVYMPDNSRNPGDGQ